MASRRLLAVGGGEVFPAGFAHAEALVVGEDYEVVGSAVAVDLVNPCDFYDYGAMDADELGRVELVA